MPVPESLTCTACGAREFVRVPGASFELWISSSPGISRRALHDPAGDLVVCLSCGKIELFVADPKKLLTERHPKRYPSVPFPPSPTDAVPPPGRA